MSQLHDRATQERAEQLVSQQLAGFGAPTGKHTINATSINERIFASPPAEAITAEAANTTLFYTVWLGNETSETLQVTIYFVQSSAPNQVQEITHTVTPSVVDPFLLGESGQCSYIVAYVMGFFLNGELVARWPESGAMTPQLASQLNSNDTDPCVDTWTIG